jgi:CheY-like chemotaxis protein
MSEDFHFLWIDDDPSMRQAANNLEAKTGAQVQFHDLTGQDLDKKIGNLVREYPSDLFMVDHRLDQTVGNLRTSFGATGATAAEMLKDSNPNVPVICVTKVEAKDITLTQKSAYDAILSAADLNRQSQIILPIAKGFREIKTKPPKDEDELLKLLGCPQVDNDRLKQVLPDNVKTGIGQAGYASLLLRWIMDFLFARPGFLYDSLWAATLVGAKENYFNATQEKLKSATYGGIFANEADPRWWVSIILETLYKTDLSNEEKDPRRLGRAYLEIPPEEYSKCYVTGEDLPDTVAYTDTTNKKCVQVSLRHTQAHPGFAKLLFFEEIRVVKDKQ